MDEDGHFWLMGRVDDVINVSGHRLGTMEIESALTAHKKVAEAAVVGYPHQLKDQAILAFVTLEAAHQACPAKEELRTWVAKEIGSLACPEDIRLTINYLRLDLEKSCVAFSAIWPPTQKSGATPRDFTVLTTLGNTKEL